MIKSLLLPVKDRIMFFLTRDNIKLIAEKKRQKQKLTQPEMRTWRPTTQYVILAMLSPFIPKTGKGGFRVCVDFKLFHQICRIKHCSTPESARAWIEYFLWFVIIVGCKVNLVSEESSVRPTRIPLLTDGSGLFPAQSIWQRSDIYSHSRNTILIRSTSVSLLDLDKHNPTAWVWDRAQVNSLQLTAEQKWALRREVRAAGKYSLFHVFTPAGKYQCEMVNSWAHPESSIHLELLVGPRGDQAEN